MSWENVEERLNHAFPVMVPVDDGAIWLPETHLDIDQWLTSVAETDEELEELSIPRIRFIQNHWVLEKLLELEWKDTTWNKRTVWAMYAGRRAYILFSDRFQYELVAAIEPKTKPALYQTVLENILRNPALVPQSGLHVKDYRPDFFSMPFSLAESGAPPLSIEKPARHGSPGDYLSEVLVGWVGEWMTPPAVGFWHEDEYKPAMTSGMDTGTRAA